jgi:hypothetical protein
MGSATDYDGCCELEKSILAIVKPFDTHRCPTIFAFFKLTNFRNFYGRLAEAFFLLINPRVVNISLPPNKLDLSIFTTEPTRKEASDKPAMTIHNDFLIVQN